MITRKYYKLVRVSYADSDLFRVTNISDQAGTLTVTRQNQYLTPNLEYSTDGVNFTSVTDWTNPLTITVPAGGNVYMKGTVAMSAGGSIGETITINMNVEHSIGGNLVTLLDKNDYSTLTTLGNKWIGYIFLRDTNLVNAHDLNFGLLTHLPAMGSFFYGCTSLVSVPDFSQFTTLYNRSSIQNMFKGCTSLTTGIDLTNIVNKEANAPAQWYISLYEDCTSLNKAYTHNLSEWDTNNFNWLRNTSQSGTVYCANQTIYDTIPANDYSTGVPSGWTKTLI